MDDTQGVITALENPDWDWRTIEGVAKDTKLPPERVIQIIESLPDVVIRSKIPDNRGRDLYTTRKHYSETQSLFSRILSASSDSIK